MITCGSDETPPISCKKFHLPHGASQGKQGTKGDRAKYEAMLTGSTNKEVFWCDKWTETCQAKLL